VRSTLPLRARRGTLRPTEVQAWSALRHQFRQAVDGPTTRTHFETIRARSPALEAYATPDCLLAYLARDLGADLELKGHVYADLVRCAQTDGPISQVAQSLLWLGLWPGLSGAFVRRAIFWRDATDELIAELIAIFTDIVARLNLSRVRNVIGTLVRSTERDIIQTGLARDRLAATEIPTVAPEALDRRVTADVTEPDSEKTLATLAGAIKKRGHDPAVQAAIYGLGPHHIALALGLKPAAARKRLERARRWIRTELTSARCPAQCRPSAPPAGSP
jgi:hypothetical protein